VTETNVALLTKPLQIITAAKKFHSTM